MSFLLAKQSIESNSSPRGLPIRSPMALKQAQILRLPHLAIQLLGCGLNRARKACLCVATGCVSATPQEAVALQALSVLEAQNAIQAANLELSASSSEFIIAIARPRQATSIAGPRSG
jgi:hypothetical protein